MGLEKVVLMLPRAPVSAWSIAVVRGFYCIDDCSHPYVCRLSATGARSALFMVLILEAEESRTLGKMSP